ncbi:SusE domain-containing protein [Flavobacterium sp. U410]|jgi:hypothetical protein
MKKIFKISALLLTIFMGISCENDDQTIIAPSGGPELLSPADGNSYVLLQENASNEITTLVWNHADYGVQTEVNYEIETAIADTDFATIISGGTTNNRYYTWTAEQLNTIMLDLGGIPYVATNINVRIKSSLGTNGDVVAYSNVITLTVTPYPTDLPKIAVPGNHQGWNPATAPLLAASDFGKTDFVGYAWLDGEFKFLAQSADGTFSFPPTGGPDYGDDGTFSGVLIDGAGETNCNATTAGYYYIQANTGEITTENPNGLTYSITSVSWGIIGFATAGNDSGWNQDIDFTYNPTTKKLEIANIYLYPGEFKFRGNNEWGQFDLGTLDEDEHLQNGGNLTFSGAAGNYKVELDLSNPRQYTYTLTAL